MAHEARHEQNQQADADDLPLLVDSDVQAKKDYIDEAVKRTRLKQNRDKKQANHEDNNGK